MVAIIAFTGASTILVGCLGIAALNVVVRRESANVVEKQIQLLVETSRSVAPAILAHAGGCDDRAADSGGLKALLTYTDQAFPQAQTYLTVESAKGVQSLLPGPVPLNVKHPDWMPASGFSGLVAYRGQIEIRNVVVKQKAGCKVTVMFNLPLGSELAKRLSSAAGVEVTAISPSPYSPSQQILRTMERNFLPGLSRSAVVVLTARDWDTGVQGDWITYSVRNSYSSTFDAVVRLGSQPADWVWLLAALSVAVLLMGVSGVWMCIRFGNDLATAIDDLSGAARQIARGNFAWRTPVRSTGQLGELAGSFNEMAIALEQLKKEEAAKLKLESELQATRTVQEYLYPRVAPQVRGATVSGKTVAAQTIGGELYDFFDLGQERIGILCAHVSGKGIPAALMMSNLQAIARAYLGDRTDGRDVQPAHFVETLNQQLFGRFGDNRYAALFWGEYDARIAILTSLVSGKVLCEIR
jgi:HAMP domain-containing protein